MTEYVLDYDDEAERRAEIRREAAETIERANRLLAQPRPPIEVREAAERAQQQAAEHRQELARLAAKPARKPAPKPAPQPAPDMASREWVRSLLDQRQDALEQAIGKVIAGIRDEARTLVAVRCAEAERLVAELEARIAALEKARQ